MIVLMQHGATEHQVRLVCDAIREAGYEPLVLPGEDRVAIGIPANVTGEDRPRLEGILESTEGVHKVTQVTRPYKLTSLEFHRTRTSFEVKGVKIGAETFTVFGGPCSVESYEQFSDAARVAKEAGTHVLRGGAFKPRTSPYAFQGLQVEGLKIMKSVGEEVGMPTVSEVMAPDMVGVVAEHVDILQIGARSMQNFPLLNEAGASGKPVFLKRGPAATIDEFLLAAEYLLNKGNYNVILCERGIVPLDRSYTRNTFDLSAVPVLLDHTHLPVVADPSHGTGVAKYVAPMAKAALVAGAMGVMIEMHPNPKLALSDGSQALPPQAYATLLNELRQLAGFLGRTMV